MATLELPYPRNRNVSENRLLTVSEARTQLMAWRQKFENLKKSMGESKLDEKALESIALYAGGSLGGIVRALGDQATPGLGLEADLALGVLASNLGISGLLGEGSGIGAVLMARELERMFKRARAMRARATEEVMSPNTTSPDYWISVSEDD